jgi:putative ABC transport system permease protein
MVPLGGETRLSLVPVTFLEIQDSHRTFEHMVAQRYNDVTVDMPDGPARLVGIGVTEAWTETLGVAPLVGRAFNGVEQAAGEAAESIVISHALWQRRFAGAPSVLGAPLTINGRTRTVVGVMPPGFRYPYEADVWFPMRLTRDSAGTWGLNVQARLRPDVTLTQASADLSAIGARLEREYPARHRRMTLRPLPLRDLLIGDQGRVVLAMFGAVGLVLLIVCANVASLLLARAIARRREMAVKAALGASRTRRVVQLLTESGLLATAGALSGLALAVWVADVLMTLVPGSLSHVVERIPIDAAALGFTAAITIATTIAAGLAPAWRASRGDLHAALKDDLRSSGSRDGRRVMELLVVGEVALALALLATAAVMVRSFQRQAGADLGYPADGLITLSVSLDRDSYQEPERRVAFVERARAALRTLPGVRGAGATTIFPSPAGNTMAALGIEGRPAPETPLMVNHRLVTEGFLETLGVRLLRGRGIEPADRAGTTPVAVVSESLARRHWPDGNPLGMRVRNARLEAAPWLTVVGVVSDVKEFDSVPETWYLPYAQNADSPLAGQATFVVRSDGAVADPETLMGAIWSVDRTLAVYDLLTPRALYGDSLADSRFSTTVVGLFACAGLLLAALGVYGVMSYLVATRRREFGVRMALGATPRQILQAVIVRGLLLLISGGAAGVLVGFVTSRLLVRVAPDVSAVDPLAYLAAVACVVPFTLLASYLPARRATRWDPMESLRTDQ